MNEDQEFLKNDFFYEFGVLPAVTIHSPQEYEYSKKYTPRKKCECGCSEWIENETFLLGYYDGTPIQRDVQRCRNCFEVRLADHIEVINER